MEAVTLSCFILQALFLVSRSQPSCYEIFAPEHGRVDFIKRGNYYHVVCDTGYIMHGSPYVYCENGKWQSSPTCIESVVCEELLDPENGQVECDEGPLTLGKVCRFVCFDGYQLRGPARRNCMIDQKWSGLAPECIPLSNSLGTCPLPPPLIHGTVIDCTSQNTPKTNDQCKFWCKEGYFLFGPSFLTCSPAGKLVDEDGKENFPVCVVGAAPSERGTHHIRSEYSAGPHITHTTDNRDVITNGERSRTKQDLCHNHKCAQLCRIENGQAQCRCERGYILNKQDQTSCDKNNGPPIHPRNPCEKNNGGCEHKCQFSRIGRVICSCNGEYVLAEDKKSCILPASMPARVTCNINNGGCQFSCSMRGYNSVECSCPLGYQLHTDNKNCIVPASTPDRVTCDVNNGGCQYLCSMIGYSVECSCPPGYQLHTDNKNCIVPVTPRVTCDINKGGCEYKCTMRGYTVQCSCPRGYQLDTDRKHCIDINECAQEYLNSCQHYCQNTEGSYTCYCQPGYILIEGVKCEGCRKNSYWSTEKNDCVPCPENSYTNAEGKTSVSDCICNPGFKGSPRDNIPCTDIDECASNNFGCSHTCVNIPGDVFCSCPVGYMVDKDNKTCIDIDECSIKNGGCEKHCHNTEGSFYCKCPKGYISSNKDQYSCDDLDECSINNGGCQQLCVNFRGGYHCDCENGYRLDSGLKNCIDITCPSLPVPHFSEMKCKSKRKTLPDSENYPIGTICNFKCLSGYKNSADSEDMVCQEDGTWNGALAECKSQRCPALEVPENGNVHPTSCSTEGNAVKEKCTFSCRQGFMLSGNTVFKCTRNLTWNVEKIPVCQPDFIRPSIECTRDIKVTLLPGKAAHNITLPEPDTNMESYKITPEWVNVGEPVEFPAGVTKVTFTVKSTDSNRTSKCVSIVRVIDKEPPEFLSCPDPITIEGASDGEIVTWTKPEVTDNVGVESLKSSLEVNSTLTPGSYVVDYFATDFAGNTATCSFTIDIFRVICSNLTDPVHGEANCMDWLNGVLCQPQCEDGYLRDPSEPVFYSCGDNGLWKPSEVISDCLPFTEAVSSICPDETELKIIEETGEEICLTCPSNKVWYPLRRKCGDLV